MYARIKEAIEPLAPDGWVFLVLTLDRDGTYSGQPWASADAAFKDLSQLSRNYMARLRRFTIELGAFEWAERTTKKGKLVRYKKALLSNQWVATVEAHRSGWPHVNMMIWSPVLAEYLRRDRAEREAEGERGRNASLMNPELSRLLTGDDGRGWGIQSTAEAAKTPDAVVSYIVKLAGEAGAVVGELAKLSQLPTMAPERFRRLRSGKEFLPPRRKNPAYTGTLVRRTRDQRGVPYARPLHKPPAEWLDFVVKCCVAEEARMIAELDGRLIPGGLVSDVLLPLARAGPMALDILQNTAYSI
jgi:hypothetical protein